MKIKRTEHKSDTGKDVVTWTPVPEFPIANRTATAGTPATVPVEDKPESGDGE